jgi:gliding motility-associated-like protein
LVFGGVPNYSIEWSRENQPLNQTLSSLDQLSQGQYSATIIDANGCLKYYEMEVGEIPAANVSINLSPTPFCSEIPITFGTESNKNILQWKWDFDNGKASTLAEPTIDFLSEGIHFVHLSIVDEHQCPIEEIFEFNLQHDLTVYIPNSFTPNNDGINDVFGVGGLGIDEFEMQIFNRWGEVIFESHDLEDKWTGDLKGGDYYTQFDTYLYVVKVSGTCTERKEIVGNVILIR